MWTAYFLKKQPILVITGEIQYSLIQRGVRVCVCVYKTEKRCCPLVPSEFPYQLSIFVMHQSLLQPRRGTHKGQMERATNIFSKHGNMSSHIKLC